MAKDGRQNTPKKRGNKGGKGAYEAGNTGDEVNR